MKKTLILGLVAAAVTLGGCNVVKQKQEAAPVVAAKVQTVTVAPTLESLNRRLTAVEQRNAAVDARARARRAAPVIQ